MLKKAACKIDKPMKLISKGELILTNQLLEFKTKRLFAKTSDTVFSVPLEDVLSAGSKKQFGGWTLLELVVMLDQKETTIHVSFTSLLETLSTGPMLETAITVNQWIESINKARESRTNKKMNDSDSPLKVLKMRLVNGEISEEEFMMKKQLLSE